MARIAILGSALLTFFGWDTTARACEPVTAVDSSEALPPAWRDAVVLLVDATRQPGQPWSCPGGVLKVTLEGDGATIVVQRPGARAMTRHVGSAAELLPVGKAMLAEPVPAGAPPSSSPDGAVPAGRANPDRSGQDGGPRARIDGSATARFAGVTELLLLGGGVRATLPFDAWYGSLSVRYSRAVAELGGGESSEYGLWELGLIGAVGYSLVQEPVRFDMGLVGGVAMVNLSAAGHGDEEHSDGSSEGATGADDYVDGRLGAELRLSVPVVDLLNVLVAFDTEVALAPLGGRRADPAVSAAPAYLVGLSAGLELNLR